MLHPLKLGHFQEQNATRMLELGVLFETIAFDTLDRSAKLHRFDHLKDRGVTPKNTRKRREKWLWSLNPLRSAI